MKESNSLENLVAVILLRVKEFIEGFGIKSESIKASFVEIPKNFYPLSVKISEKYLTVAKNFLILNTNRINNIIKIRCQK